MINSTETASLGRPKGCLALHPIAAKLQHQLLQKHGKSVNKEQRNNLLAPCSPSISGDQDETNCLKLCSVIFNIHPNQKKKCFCQHQIVTLNILFIPVSIQSLAEGLPSWTSSFLPRKEGHREWKPTQSPSHRKYCVGKVQGSQDFSTTSNLSGNTLCSFPLLAPYYPAVPQAEACLQLCLVMTEMGLSFDNSFFIPR